jgi:hypothetical protein
MSYAPRQEPWLEPLEIRRYDALLMWADGAMFVYRDPPASAKRWRICRRGEQ